MQLHKKGLSQRRACDLASLPPSSFYYQTRSPDETQLTARIRELSLKHPARGYRFVHALLRREGWRVGRNRVHRIWQQQSLQQAQRRNPKIRTGQTVPQAATAWGEVWAYDFVHDRLEDGRAFRILTVKDEFTRRCLALEAGIQFTAKDVLAVLERLFTLHGTPQFVRSDNGPEFIARDLTLWLASQSVHTRYIEPGKPWQNGFAESFHSRLRVECLNREVFTSELQAQVLLNCWRASYNAERPHSSLGYRTPDEFLAFCQAAPQGSRVISSP